MTIQETMKTEQDLHDFLFREQKVFSIGSGVQLAFKLLEKDTMFIADAVKIHLKQHIVDYAKYQVDQQREADLKRLEELEKLIGDIKCNLDQYGTTVPETDKRIKAALNPLSNGE